MIRSKVVDAWIDQGRVEGEVHASARLLIKVLGSKFGAVPTPTADAIRATADLPTLDAWVDDAMRATTLDDFRAAAKLP